VVIKKELFPDKKSTGCSKIVEIFGEKNKKIPMIKTMPVSDLHKLHETNTNWETTNKVIGLFYMLVDGHARWLSYTDGSPVKVIIKNPNMLDGIKPQLLLGVSDLTLHSVIKSVHIFSTDSNSVRYVVCRLSYDRQKYLQEAHAWRSSRHIRFLDDNIQYIITGFYTWHNNMGKIWNTRAPFEADEQKELAFIEAHDPEEFPNLADQEKTDLMMTALHQRIRIDVFMNYELYEAFSQLIPESVSTRPDGLVHDLINEVPFTTTTILPKWVVRLQRSVLDTEEQSLLTTAITSAWLTSMMTVYCNGNSFDVFTRDEFRSRNLPDLIKFYFRTGKNCFPADELHKWWTTSINENKAFLNPMNRLPFTVAELRLITQLAGKPAPIRAESEKYKEWRIGYDRVTVDKQNTSLADPVAMAHAMAYYQQHKPELIETLTPTVVTLTHGKKHAFMYIKLIQQIPPYAVKTITWLPEESGSVDSSTMYAFIVAFEQMRFDGTFTNTVDVFMNNSFEYAGYDAVDAGTVHLNHSRQLQKWFKPTGEIDYDRVDSLKRELSVFVGPSIFAT